MALIIGIGHQKYVGKDTFTGFCIDVLRTERRKLNIKRRGFADKVYEFCHSVYGWAGFQPKTFYDQNPERKNDVIYKGKTVRDLLIEIGTPVMRAYDDEIWINACLKSKDHDVLFVTDLRFPNEFTAVEAEGGILVRIVKPGLPVPTDVADTALNGWEDRWHHTFENKHGERNHLYSLAEQFTRMVIMPRLV